MVTVMSNFKYERLYPEEYRESVKAHKQELKEQRMVTRIEIEIALEKFLNWFNPEYRKELKRLKEEF